MQSIYDTKCNNFYLNLPGNGFLHKKKFHCTLFTLNESYGGDGVAVNPSNTGGIYPHHRKTYTGPLLFSIFLGVED
jgi:hypothetical protein